MPPLVCLGCANQFSTVNAEVNAFAQEVSPNLKKDDNSIKRGIELITGVTVSDTYGLPERLCAGCNNKIEEFLVFRSRLLNSLRVFLSSSHTSAKTDHEIGSLPLADTTQKDLHDKPVTELNKEVKTELEIKDEKNRRSTSSEGLDRINVIDEDAESEIDVCSGEDDGVLELDIQSKKDEIWEIESSDESDIQVCDYEPNGL